ncbi:MAG: hypothetical protein IPM82_06810 [Saprospiraceae bacterium]|nr:hypothetical protein [Saprospiraceae bacterium]
MLKSIPRWLLIFLLFFNAIGAYYGSIMMLLDPSGSKLQMSLENLNGSIFKNYFVPGIILLLVNGILPTIAGIGLIWRHPLKPLPGFAILKNHQWAWSLALISGLGLMIWIGVQIAMIGYWTDLPIQAVYGILGLLITALTLLPSVQHHYKINLAENMGLRSDLL